MSINFHSNLVDNSIYKNKTTEILGNQKLPTVIPGALSSNKNERLQEFKRKIEHQNRISHQQTKLEEQLDNDFNNTLPIQVILDSGQSIKKISLSDLEDSFDKSPIFTPKSKFEKSVKQNKIFASKKRRLNKKNVVLALGLASMLIVGGITFNYSLNSKIDNNIDKVANAAELVKKSELQNKMEAYSEWIKNLNNGQMIDPNIDSDKDGLTNYEEFVIGSNPFSAFSCNENINDSENLMNLINPATCRGIDLENPGDIKTFGDIINLPLLQTQIGKVKPLLETN